MGGDSGAPSGGISQLTGPTPSRLLSLFKECVDNGVWARLETYKRRSGAVCIDFNCQIVATAATSANGDIRRRNRLSKKRREHNRERTRKWMEASHHRRHPPPATMPDSAAQPVATTAAVNGLSPTTGRSYADVTSRAPNDNGTSGATANTVSVAAAATAGQKGRVKPAAPKKRAKEALVASRASHRAAQIASKRAAAVNIPASPQSAADEALAAPEVLRGTEGETWLESLDISLAASPPPPPSPSEPLSPSPEPPSTPSEPPPPPSEPPLLTPRKCKCTSSCTVECEPDYYDDVWSKGRRLNTQNPDWDTVFKIVSGVCRFCKESLPEGEEDDGNCDECNKLTILQLVVKFASRKLYPTE